MAVDGSFDGVRQLLADRPQSGPEDLAALAMAVAPALGAAELVIYLVDYGQTQLVPLRAKDTPSREPLPVEGTVAGRAFTSEQAYETEHQIWVPLLDAAQRIGVLEIVTRAAPPEEVHLLVAATIAQLVSTRRWYGDAVEHSRRTLPMQLPTEIVWGLLPPLTYAAGPVVVSGILEPCYEVGGDVFDYAVNATTTHLALFDAVGHGISASMLSTLAINAYRNARRCGLDLIDTYRSIDKWIRAEYPNAFLTAILAELDCATGRYRRVCAGHPRELLLRNGRLVRTLPGPTTLPIGMGDLSDDWPVVTEEALEPEDYLLLYTDGVIEARNETGEFFGTDRLASFLARALADRHSPAETMRRLIRAILDHQHEQLQDDATALCLHWRGTASG
jgi:sigma-B regulation protein RsbU (phosphoserine phosphatase)